MRRYKWGPWLPLLTIATATLAAVYVFWPQMFGQVDKSTLVGCLSWITAIIWFAVITMSVYQLIFQMLATFFVPPLPITLRPADESSNANDVRFVVFYLTCDDFVADCCLTCLEQDYSESRYRVVICDDSRLPEFLARVDDFRRSHPELGLVRRPDAIHYKAGNLNYAFQEEALVDCDWVVVVDADQALPQDYLSRMAELATQLPETTAFVQAGRMPLDAEYGCPLLMTPTPFQSALQPEILLFYERAQSWRSYLGFCPFLGHGGAIRASAWKSLGGFPNRVSEDIAWTMIALRKSEWHGISVHSLRSWESYPRDFSAFTTRLCKFAAGAAELFFKDQFCFVIWSSAKATDRVDALIWLWSYLLLPVGLLNLFVSCYVADEVDATGSPLLAPLLPYLFLGMWGASLAATVSVVPSLGDAIRYWFWSFAVYAAALPAAAGSFVKALAIRPVFHRTPKTDSTSPTASGWNVLSCLIGAVGLIAAITWRSPYSLVFAGFATAMFLSPLYLKLHVPDALYARACVYVPGALFMAGIVWMWIDG